MHALEIQQVSRQFGGHRALQDISLDVQPASRVAIIGPNGAGKSTLFNVLSGELPASSGRIRLAGRDVSRLAPHRRVRAGLARSFQLTRLLRSLSVFENICAAVHGPEVASHVQVVRSWRSSPAYAMNRDRAAQLLQDLGLWDVRDQGAATLPYGQQKRLEIAMALALRPRVLLLDEPAAGLAAGEIADFLATIRRNLADTTLLFTEHDMAVVFGLADRIVVLGRGQLVADGTPAMIREDRVVRELYLGPDHAGHA